MEKKPVPTEGLMAWSLPEACALCGQSVQVGSYYGIFVRARGGIPGRIMVLCADCNCRMRETLGEYEVLEKEKEGKEEGDGDSD